MDLYKQQTGQDWQPKQPFASPTTASQPSDGQSLGQTTTDTVNQQLAATQQANARAAGTAGQPSTASLNAQGLLDNPQGRAIAAGQAPVATQSYTGQPITQPIAPGMINPAYQQAYPSAVGSIATGPVVGAVGPTPSPYPRFAFQAPVTA
jgi:hypothetical protein